MKSKSESNTKYIEVRSGTFEGWRGYLTGKELPSGKVGVVLHSGKGGEEVSRYLEKNEIIPIKRNSRV